MTSILRFFAISSIIIGIITGIINGLNTGNVFSFLGILVIILNVVGGFIGAVIFMALAYILESLERITQMLSDLCRIDNPKTAYPEKGKQSIFSSQLTKESSAKNDTLYKMKSFTDK